MTEERLKTLMENIYSRADLAYRLGVLKEFLEFLFFDAHNTEINDAAFDAFAEAGHAVADATFLRSLPAAFFKGFTERNIYEEFARLSDAAQQLPVFSLTVPITLDEYSRMVVGKWARRSIGEDVLLDLWVDPEIGVGCQLVWQSRMYNFGFDHYVEANHEVIETYVEKAIAPVAHEPHADHE